MPNPTTDPWCLLIHALPPRPLYLRARIRRLLDAAGAAPLRKAVYALPASAEALERMRAVAQEIEAGGGSAVVCEATFPDEATAASVVRAYNAELDRRYSKWSASAERTLAERGDDARLLARLRRSFERLRAQDRFAAAGGAAATALLARVER